MHLHPLGLVGQPIVEACPRQQTTWLRPHEQHPILSQLERAFSQRPDPSGIIHGVRKVRRGCRGRRTSIFTSVKSGASFLLESGPELDYALLLEHDPTVTSFRTQAIGIALPGEGVAYPDFAIRLETGYEVHEVKASAKTIDLRTQKRFEMMRRKLEDCGVVFKVVEADKFPMPQQMHRLNAAYSRGHAIPFTGADVTAANEMLSTQTLPNEAAAYKYLADLNIAPSIADFLWFHGRLAYGTTDLILAKGGLG